MKNITRKCLNLIQKVGGTTVILKLASWPAVNSLQSFWHKQSYRDYRNQYLILKRRLNRAGKSLAGLSVLEVGAGGSVGMGYFFLADGCKSWLATDLFSNLLADKKWLKNEKRIVESVSKKDWPAVKSFVKFEQNKVKFKPPVKFKKLDITSFDKSLAGKFDVVVSQAVLEHVPKDQIPPAIKNLSKYLKKGGLMIHEIDLRDHINILNPYNFYRYDEAAWNKMTKDSIFYTNRLRVSDYKKEFTRNRLQEVQTKVERMALAPGLPISRNFEDYSKIDLKSAIIFTILVKN